jgi:hypothetical protein
MDALGESASTDQLKGNIIRTRLTHVLEELVMAVSSILDVLWIQTTFDTR